jgi:hypothetical protein
LQLHVGLRCLQVGAFRANLADAGGGDGVGAAVVIDALVVGIGELATFGRDVDAAVADAVAVPGALDFRPEGDEEEQGEGEEGQDALGEVFTLAG